MIINRHTGLKKKRKKDGFYVKIPFQGVSSIVDITPQDYAFIKTNSPLLHRRLLSDLYGWNQNHISGILWSELTNCGKQNAYVNQQTDTWLQKLICSFGNNFTKLLILRCWFVEVLITVILPGSMETVTDHSVFPHIHTFTLQLPRTFCFPPPPFPSFFLSALQPNTLVSEAVSRMGCDRKLLLILITVSILSRTNC